MLTKRVAIISTEHRCGATTATLLMSAILAHTQGRTVRICYTGENQALRKYTGEDLDVRDATCTISQVSKLLEAHAIGPEGLGDYCRRIAPGVDVMDSWDESLTEEEMTNLLTYTFSRSTTDFTLCDLAHSIETPVAQEVMQVCDAAIIVTEPSQSALKRVRELQESPYWPKDTHCMLLISKYHELIGSVEKMAREAQFPKRSVCKVHYNPLVTKQCDSGELCKMIPFILKRDPRVIELNNDLRECTQYLMSLASAKIKWEG